MRRLWKYGLVAFIFLYLAINWQEIGWVFHYETAQDAVESAFLEGETKEEGKILEVPALNLYVPIVFATSVAEKDLKDDLDRGVVLFPGTSIPGEGGQAVILGHSAPEGWPNIKHDWVFSDLEDLKEGDEVIVHWDKRKMTYRVSETIFIDRGAMLPEEKEGEDSLIMISCWPPGKNIRRIAVVSFLQ
ncbi:MAG: sortase [Syntrophales bacterium]|nr:sortase [Syntrophales bacterium]